MPTRSSVLHATGQRKFNLTLSFLLFPLLFWGQSLSGLWTGVITSDSTSIRKDQSFEIALTEYRGKVYGYSRSEFIVNDTLYYIVKRVKGIINGDMCEVKDDEIISCNFQKRLNKGVKVVSTFYRNKQDSVWYLAGKWKTTQTKNYYSITGKVALAEEKDLSKSKIFPHLEELNLANDVAFYKERKTDASVVKNAVPESKHFASLIKTEELSTLAINNEKPLPETGKVEVNMVAIENKQTIRTETLPVKAASAVIPVSTELTKAEPKEEAERLKTNIHTTELNTIPNDVKPATPDTKAIAVNTVNVKTETPLNTKADIVKPVNAGVAVKTDAALTKAQPVAITGKEQQVLNRNDPNYVDPNEDPDNLPRNLNTKQNTIPVASGNKPATSGQQPVANIKNTPVVENKQPLLTSTQVVTSNGTGPVTDTKLATATPVNAGTNPEITHDRLSELKALPAVGGRTSAFSQIINFSSDSLEIALYDNGEIDGDTVSVFMNGEPILSHQCLKASAIKTTIHLTPGIPEFNIVLFADNLGKYPPNTGLLVVHDGDDVYNIRFSADLQKNAGVIFRRK